MSKKLSDSEKSRLEQIANSSQTLLAKRATIILMNDEDIPPVEIAQKVQLTPRTVRRWQKKFKQNRLAIFSETVLPKPATLTEDTPSITESADPKIKSGAEKPGFSKKPGFSMTIEYPVRSNIGLVPTDTLAEADRKISGFFFARMLKHEPGTRQGEDIEALHDMRVAIRRMRTAFDVFGHEFTKKSTKPLLKGLKAAGQALGQVRDLDVFMEDLDRYQHSTTDYDQADWQILLDIWQAKREQARLKMLEHLDGKKYLQFKQNMLKFVKTEGLGVKPAPAGTTAASRLNLTAPGLIYARYEAVRAYETELDQASMATLHQLRIAFKKFRYILEYLQEILGDERKMVIEEVKTLQDHLGALHDADVAIAILSDLLNNWNEYQIDRPMAERQNPVQIAAYLNSRVAERHRLIVTFPEAWARFNRPEFRRNLALAISVL